MNAPQPLAVNGQNTVYVADGRSLRTISSAGQVATAYTAEVGSNVSEGSMSQSWLGAVAVDGNGNLFMTNGYGTRRLASGNAVLMLEGDQVRNDLSGTRGEFAVGLAAQVSEVLQLHGEFQYSNGKHIEQPYGVNLGLRYNF